MSLRIGFLESHPVQGWLTTRCPGASLKPSRAYHCPGFTALCYWPLPYPLPAPLTLRSENYRINPYQLILISSHSIDCMNGRNLIFMESDTPMIQMIAMRPILQNKSAQSCNEFTSHCLFYIVNTLFYIVLLCSTFCSFVIHLVPLFYIVLLTPDVCWRQSM